MREYKIIGLTEECKNLTKSDFKDLKRALGEVATEYTEKAEDGGKLFTILSLPIDPQCGQEVHEKFLILE